MLSSIHPTPQESPGVVSFVQQALDTLAMAHDAIISNRVRQTIQANKGRREEKEGTFVEGQKVYLSTTNLAIPKHRARKLVPRWIGPYEITKAYPEKSTYHVELPEALASRNIHNVFHASQLRPHKEDDDEKFPGRINAYEYDVGEPPQGEIGVMSISAHRWLGRTIEFQVNWADGDITWEPYQTCKNLRALDEYCVLQNVRNWKDIPKSTMKARSKPRSN